MDKAKHTFTPGPWAVNPLDVDYESNSIFAGTLANGGRRLVATVATGGNASADASLIAAAPELLEALEHARDYLRRPKFDPAMRDAVAVVLEAAIAKAVKP